MPELTSFTKDPDATLDYVWDWSAWLGDDTIVTHVVTAEDGITVETSTVADGRVTVWLSGGTARQAYRVTCSIVTAAGRADDRTSRFHVTER